MGEGLTKLKDIGAQKIYEQTHIARVHVQAVLHESFDGITRVQFLGFISILEREYDVELSDLRLKGEEFYDELAIDMSENKKVLLLPEKNKTSVYVYLVIIIALIVVGLFFADNLSESTLQNESVQIKKEIVIKKIIPQEVIIEDNATEVNSSVDEVIVEETKAIQELQSFKIVPKSRLWVGYMDIQTHKKKQGIITDELELDATKDWLLSFGHGHVDIYIDDNLTKYRRGDSIKLLYKDRNISRINFKEYKVINKGSRW